jgi:hypothetical protein
MSNMLYTEIGGVHTNTNNKLQARAKRSAKPSAELEPKVKNYLVDHLRRNVSSAAQNINVPPQYFSGSQLKALYNVPTVVPSPNAKKTTIAIVVAFKYSGLRTDLATYWQNSINFGPNSTPPTINVYTMPNATFNSGWAQEECLDVQMVCTMNPNANIWVVEAKSDTFTDMMAAVNYATNTILADVVSMSWGADDRTHFAPYASNFTNKSVCYCAATGDANTANWPAVLSNCIAVGGTSVIWTPNTTPNSGNSNVRTEFTWTGAGCGYSASVTQPTYQKNVSTISHSYRAIPDVSMIANPQTSVYTVFQGQWSGVGGTSVSTPLFASILSLANQLRFNQNKPALTSVFSDTAGVTPTNLQNYLYKTIYTTSSQYTSAFYDVLMGTDDGSVGGNSVNLTKYAEGTGYSLPTGLGSPNATNLCNLLVNV